MSAARGELSRKAGGCKRSPSLTPAGGLTMLRAMRILTGIQPSGTLHIGNYFGAMKPAIGLQDEGEAFIFIADYHSMTTVRDPEALRANVREVAIDLLACGLDPDKVVFFRQSDVPEVNELAWILSTVCPLSLLEKCHSYKDKVARGISPSHALFAYPVLMAADILLYDAARVPVGKDQKQHLEVTRDLAGKVNDAYGEGTLVVPEPVIRDEVAVVPGLDGQKMSKSYNNGLPMFGAEKASKKLIMRIVTDSTPVEDPKPVDGSLILPLFRLFADDAAYRAMIDDHQRGGVGYGDFKKRLAEAYWDYFAPMRARREELMADSGHVDEVLARGAGQARNEAAKVIDRVRRAVGLS